MVTKAELKKFLPSAKTALVTAVVDNWDAAVAAGVTNPKRIRQFLSNVAVETGGLTSICESLNYSVDALLEKFGRHRISVDDAKRYGRTGNRAANQQVIANLVYGGTWGKKHLGNTKPDDGWTRRGGGMLQTTGRDNYNAMGFGENPEVLQTNPKVAFQTACREWKKRGCNELADADKTDELRKAINGGTNGLADVKAYLVKAKKVWPDVVSAPAMGLFGTSALAPVVEETPVYTEEDIRGMQTMLRGLGYPEVGTPDGRLGRYTRTAILAFRADNGLPLTTDIDQEFVTALHKAKPREVDVARASAVPSKIISQVPEVRSNFISKVFSAVTATGAAASAFVTGALDNISSAKAYIDPLKEYASNIPGWAWLIAVAIIAGFIFSVSRHGEKKGVEAFQSGERR